MGHKHHHEEWSKVFRALQYIRSGRSRSMRVVDATSVTHQMLGALTHLHDRGILHRNVVANTVLLKPLPGKLGPTGRPQFLALLSGFSCTVVVRKASRRCCSQPGNEACGFRPATYAENLSVKIDCWYLGILMLHMVTGYLPSAIPTAQRFCDQLTVSAPSEYVQLAMSLANEKPFERPNIPNALQDCTRLLQAVFPLESNENGDKQKGGIPQLKYSLRQTEQLTRPTERSTQMLELSLRPSGQSIKMLESPSQPTATNRKNLEVPSRQLDSIQKLLESLTVTIEPPKQHHDLAMIRIDDALKQMESSTDQPQNVISMYHRPIKHSQSIPQQPEKPAKALDGTIKLSELSIRKDELAAKSPKRAPKEQPRQPEISLTYSESCLRQIDMQAKISRDRVPASRSSETKLLIPKGRSESSPKQSNISLETSRITTKLEQTPEKGHSSAKTSTRGSPKLMKLIEQFSKQSQKSASQRDHKDKKSSTPTKFLEKSVKKSRRQTGSPGRKTVDHSDEFNGSLRKKRIGQRKKTGITSKSSKNPAQLTDIPSKRSPKRATQDSERPVKKSFLQIESESVSKISPSPKGKAEIKKSLGSVKKATGLIRKPLSMMKKSGSCRGIGSTQYSPKLTDISGRKPQNLSRGYVSQITKSSNFAKQTDSTTHHSQSSAKVVETPLSRSQIFSLRTKSLRRSPQRDSLLVHSSRGKSEQFKASPTSGAGRVRRPLCEDPGRQTRSSSRKSDSCSSKQKEKRIENICKADEEVSKQSDEEPSP